MMASMYFVVYTTYALAFCKICFGPLIIHIGEGSRMIATGELNAGKLMKVLWSVIFGAFALGNVGPRVQVFA